MLVSEKNLKTLKLTENDEAYLRSLLSEVEEINNMWLNRYQEENKLSIHYENEHTEYSPERVDPCPDYFGTYYLMSGKEVLDDGLSLEHLDDDLYVIYNFVLSCENS